MQPSLQPPHHCPVIDALLRKMRAWCPRRPRESSVTETWGHRPPYMCHQSLGRVTTRRGIYGPGRGASWWSSPGTRRGYGALQHADTQGVS